MRRFLAVLLAVTLVTIALAAQAARAQLIGIARSSTGAALPGAILTIVSLDAPRPAVTATADARGRFTVRDLPPGHYRLEATFAGYVSTSWTVDLVAGATRDASFTLRPGHDTTPVRPAEVPRAEIDNKAASQGQREAMAPPTPRTMAPMVTGIAGGFATKDAFNTEAYDRIDDSQWTHVANRPLSTFSADVDTAAYANMRRFLNQGTLPPKDAVRIEELVNYFSYDYPEPRGDAPFSITTAIGDAPWNSRHKLALIGLQARHLDLSKTPPRNLVFLVDVSGSMMSPNKLPLVKASLAMLARNLTDRDRIAIAVYAGAAGLALPSTPGGDTSTILSALGNLQAGGSTNGAQGLRLAYNVARQHFIKGGANRVILATDGDFNVGVSSQGELIRLIEEERQSGVTLSVLGFGMGNLKDSTMEKLADHGNGNYSYIDSISEAQKVLVEEAAGTLITVAKDVKLQVEFNPRIVSAYRLIGYENRRLEDRDFNDDTKDAGDMGAGHSVTALYEIELAGADASRPDVDPLKYQRQAPLSGDASRDEAFTVKARYKKPEASESALLSVPVSARTTNSPTISFAAAVAEFGMLLRDSEFKGSASFTHVASVAEEFKTADPHGHRAEFVRLVRTAESLSASAPDRQRRE